MMRKPNKTARLFIKTFLAITVFSLLTGSAIGFALSHTIRPPAVPNIPVMVIYPALPDPDGGPTSLDGDALPPPHLVQYEERRPSFFTFLIFGLTEGNHANTVMVAAYDAEARQGYIISIPRDTRVDFQRNRRKIVSAYLVGRLNDGSPEDGAARMKHEVATLVGFRPDFYIRVDYEAFVRMVDAVGGVAIDVPFHMRYDDPCQNLHINIPAGLQVLDGQNALHFARYRMGNDRRQTISDYQRIVHQQQVLQAVAYALLTPASLLRIPEFVSIFNAHVDTNLSPGEIMWFANQGRHIGGLEALNIYTLPMLGSSGAPAWYEMADKAGILELVNRTVNPLVRDITPADVRIVR